MKEVYLKEPSVRKPCFSYYKTYVIKGLDYSEKISRAKSGFETVQHWRLKRNRPESAVGIWCDGEKVADYSTMKNGFHIIRTKWES